MLAFLKPSDTMIERGSPRFRPCVNKELEESTELSKISGLISATTQVAEFLVDDDRVTDLNYGCLMG
jgi:hypothetical protein